MSAVITLVKLESLNACREQRDKFARLFPKGSPRTRKAALVAAKQLAAVFDWDWAADNLLRAPAWAAYDEATAPAFVNAWFDQQESAA